MMFDWYDELAQVSGTPAASIAAARALFDGVRAQPSTNEPGMVATAIALKRRLAEAGVRDDPGGIRLQDIVERRRGNCLALTLLLGAELRARGYAPRFEIVLNPYDDVHAAGNEYLATLLDPREGVDCESRLPEASDRSARFRFVPLEHPSMLLDGGHGDEMPFEATGLLDLLNGAESTWTPEAERRWPVSFQELAANVLCDRSKHLVAESDPEDGDAHERALGLALGVCHTWPSNQEAWAQSWELARALSAAPGGSAEHVRIAAEAARHYRALGATSSLACFTAYRMSGAIAELDDALARFPAYVEARYARHVSEPLASGALEELQREFIVCAWCVAGSEVLDLRRFYGERRAAVERLFGPAELEALMSSFGPPAPRGDAGNRT